MTIKVGSKVRFSEAAFNDGTDITVISDTPENRAWVGTVQDVREVGAYWEEDPALRFQAFIGVNTKEVDGVDVLQTVDFPRPNARAQEGYWWVGWLEEVV